VLQGCTLAVSRYGAPPPMKLWPLASVIAAVAVYGCGTSTANSSPDDPTTNTDKTLPAESDPAASSPSEPANEPEPAPTTAPNAEAGESNTEDDPSLPAGNFMIGTFTQGSASITLDPAATAEHHANFGFYDCGTTAAQNGGAYGATITWDDGSVPSVGTVKAVAQGKGVLVMINLPTGESTTTNSTVKFTKADKTKLQFEGEISDVEAPFDSGALKASKLEFRCRF
jgi:hypothetical protein